MQQFFLQLLIRLLKCVVSVDAFGQRNRQNHLFSFHYCLVQFCFLNLIVILYSFIFLRFFVLLFLVCCQLLTVGSILLARKLQRRQLSCVIRRLLWCQLPVFGFYDLILARQSTFDCSLDKLRILRFQVRVIWCFVPFLLI